jgi:hypothetical protein
MVLYKCNQCNKTFGKKSNYESHLNRKNPCSAIRQTSAKSLKKSAKNPPKSENSKNMGELDDSPSKNFICNYCKNSFTRSDSLLKHIKNRCKIKKHEDNEKEELLTKLIDEMKEMREEIKKLKTENNNYKQINQTISTQNNIQINNNNIKILSFGKEDISHITDDIYKRILKKGMGSVPTLIEYIHFNKNKPENHNVYISNMRSNYAMIYDELNWKLKDQNEVLEMLFGKIDILEEKYDELLKDLSEPTIDLLKEIFEGKNDYPIGSEIRKRIKLLLYNKKNIPEKTKELMNSNNFQKKIDN